MQKEMCCQPPMLVSFTVPLWQNAFSQVLCDWTSLVFTDEHNPTFFSVCCKLASPTLGLDSVCNFTHARPIEVCPLKFAVKVDLSAGFASQDPTWHPAVIFSSYQGVIF